MGVLFRSGGYIKFVWCGGRTIKDGEAAAIWNRQGIHTQVIGPKRVSLWFSTIRFLTRFKAESHQYLVVKHKDGRREHIQGPATLFANPAYHDDVSVKDAILLKSDSESIVVYVYNHDTDKQKYEYEPSSNNGATRGKKNDTARRVIIQGPTLFVPRPNEEIHEFSWSKFGSDGKPLIDDRERFCVFRGSSHSLAPSSSLKMKFELPNTHSIQAELDVQFCFQLGETVSEKYLIESLLRTEDPILKMYKAIQADAVSIGMSSSFSLDDIRSGNCEKIEKVIGDKGSYMELNKAAKECSIEIISLRLVNWRLDDDLVDLIRDERALSRKVQSELAEKEQRQKILILEQENKRKAVEDEAELKRMKLTSDDQIDREMHKMKIASVERSMELQMLQVRASHEQEETSNGQILSLLKEMKNIGVDLTQFLVSANQHQGSTSVVKGDLLKDVKVATEKLRH